MVGAALLAGLLAGTVSAGVRVGACEGGRCEARFSFSAQIGVGSAAVAGDFNGWKKDALLLRDPEGDGLFEGETVVEPGRHLYKFVIDGRLWKTDSENPASEPDGFTGFNSVFTAGGGPAAPAAPSRLGDGELDAESILHSTGIAFREWVPWEGAGYLRLRTAGDDVEKVWLLIRGAGQSSMTKVRSAGGYDLWEAMVIPSRGGSEYGFLLEDGGESRRFGALGLTSGRMQGGSWFRAVPDEMPRMDVPEWAMDAVFYQIFPERFFNGDPANDPEDAEPWGAAPKLFNHFGGDLEGIRQKLPYLEELGINALYLNPVFESPSNHKYDTADYKKIDPHFGTNAGFERLAAEARRRGVRIILDGVFNHSGDKHWAFQDLIENGKDSKYRDWYTVHSFPVVPSTPTYECWWGFGHLPKLNTSDPELRSYLMDVAGYWMREGASGWRLDVPNEVPHGFWKEFRRVVKKADPEAYIVGEIWQDGSPWLKGDEFDAVMNYVFRSAVLGFFATGQLSLDEFDRQLAAQRSDYPRALLPLQFNLLGSHDTERIFTVFKGDLDKLKLAVFFQMSYLGIPVVYYGDEVGLPGGKDPDCRRCFPWEPSARNGELLAYYKKLISLRNANAALRRGEFRKQFLDPRRGVYAYTRSLDLVEPGPRSPGETTILAVVHNGPGTVRVMVPVPHAFREEVKLRDLIGGGAAFVAGDSVLARLEPYQGLLLVPAR